MATPEPAYEFEGQSPLPPDRREFLRVSAYLLVIDRSVQRELDSERISKIGHTFNWSLFEVPTCVKLPDGTYRVIEGQHRVAALKLRDTEAMVWIAVVPAEDAPAPPSEAAIALTITSARRPHDSLSKWELRSRRGDEHERMAEDLLRVHKLRLGRSTGESTIKAVGVLDSLIHKPRLTPEEATLLVERLLLIIESAYPPDQPDSRSTRWDGRLLRAIGELVYRNPHIEIERMADSLRERIAAQWISQAVGADRAAWFVIAENAMQRYNRGLRNPERRIDL